MREILKLGRSLMRIDLRLAMHQEDAYITELCC